MASFFADLVCLLFSMAIQLSEKTDIVFIWHLDIVFIATNESCFCTALQYTLSNIFTSFTPSTENTVYRVMDLNGVEVLVDKTRSFFWQSTNIQKEKHLVYLFIWPSRDCLNRRVCHCCLYTCICACLYMDQDASGRRHEHIQWQAVCCIFISD